jgi:hypothetical protein
MDARRSFNTQWLPAVLVAALFLVVLRAQLSTHNHDPSYFISIGGYYVVRADDVPPNVRIIPASSGYDGQFFYQLALNPFAPQEVNAGLTIGNGPYRHQRIIYPLLVWLCAFGNRDLIPAALVIVNYLALCGLAWLGGRFAQLHQCHALWGALFALYPGFLFTLTRDLAEILAAVFLLAGLLSLQQSSSSWRSAVWLALAVFTRETTVLAVLALACASIVGNVPIHRRTIGIPLCTFGAWQVFLWAKWGQLPVLAGGHNLGFPGGGIITFLNSLQIGNLMHGVWLLELIALLFVAVATTVALRTTNDIVPYKLMGAGYGLLVVMLTRHVWVEDLAFMRAATELYLLGLVLMIANRHLSLLASAATMMMSTWVLVFFTRLDW